MNSLIQLRKLLTAAYEAYPGQGKEDEFSTFNARPFIAAFEEVQFSEAKWFSIYQSVKETLIHNTLNMNQPWVDHAYPLASKQGRHQGYINLDREAEKQMAEEDGSAFWAEPFTKTILDHQIHSSEVKEKVPGLYLTKNKNCLLPYLNHQTDGRLSQTGKYEKGNYQSEYAQVNFGIFFNQRALQYENPDDDTVVTKKALVKIQIEQDLFLTKKEWKDSKGKFQDKLCYTGTDKVDKVKVQMISITRKV